MCSQIVYKLLWFTSIYAVTFFTFLQIALARQPQFLAFKPKRGSQTANSCLIVTIIYVGIFAVTSALWFRDNCIKNAAQIQYSVFVEEKPNRNGQTDSPSTERMLYSTK